MINMSKKLTTIICCIAFAIGGYYISSTNNANILNAKAVYAANTPVVMQYPKDLLLGHRNDVGLKVVRDTIRDTIPLEVRHDTVTTVKYKTKIKWRTRNHIPDTIASQAKKDVDTLYISKPTLVVPVDSVSL